MAEHVGKEAGIVLNRKRNECFSVKQATNCERSEKASSEFLARNVNISEAGLTVLFLGNTNWRKGVVSNLPRAQKWPAFVHINSTCQQRVYWKLLRAVASCPNYFCYYWLLIAIQTTISGFSQALSCHCSSTIKNSYS
jgi:hypothetical protein